MIDIGIQLHKSTNLILFLGQAFFMFIVFPFDHPKIFIPFKIDFKCFVIKSKKCQIYILYMNN